MKVRTGSHKFRIRFVLSLIFLSCIAFHACTKKDAPPENPPIPPSKPISQPDKYIITSVKGADKNLGLLINDPLSKMQYAAFGSKDDDGKPDTIYLIVETHTETGGWLSHELNEDYTPSSTTTSTGHTIEYEDFDNNTKTGSVTIKNTETGAVIHKTGKIKFNDDVWNSFERIKELNTQRPGFPPHWQSELVYVGSAAFGCIMGVAGLSTGNPLALGWGIYNTYQNCKSFAEAANNILNGQPAFGCISTMDNVNALSGFAETISQGGGLGSLATGLVPAIMNYVAQDGVAGQCEDEDEPDDLLPAGGGQGDPHIYTPDGKTYDFHGFGEFIAMKSLTDNFEVQVRQEKLPYIKAQATVNRGVAVQTGTDIVCVTVAPQRLYINNQLHDFNFQALSLQQGASLEMKQEGPFPILVIRSKYGDLVKVRLDQTFNGSMIDYKILAVKSRAGKTKGLLGNADGNKDNDLQLANGQVIEYSFENIYPAFANSWRITQSNSLFYYEQGKNTSSHTQLDFPSKPVEITAEKLAWAEQICKTAGVTLQPALCNCTMDVAVSDDPLFSSSALWDQITWTPGSAPFDMQHTALQGDATLIDGRLRLTPATVFTSGQAFHTTPVTGDFETTFSFRLPVSGNGGADGFALLIAKEIPTLKINTYPGSAGKLGYEGVPSSLAVEFDTWPDAGENSNHVAIHTKGIQPNSTHYSNAKVYNGNIPEMQGLVIHKAKVKYTGNKIIVWLDGNQVLEYNVDLFTSLGLSDKFFIGLVASTSGSFQEHNILEWKLTQ
ncbi:MAG: VWD domain-containing protein [Chitinophagaceae bacterium]